MFTFSQFQDEINGWQGRPLTASPEHSLIGLTEEVGELCAAFLKEKRGVKGTREQHHADAKDAIGDILVYLAEFCFMKGWDLEDIIYEVWQEVKDRNYRKMKERNLIGENS